MTHLSLRARVLKHVQFVSLLITTAIGMNAQVTTAGFLNLPRTEAPGTLLSHPLDNDSEAIGRTTSINYLNGWIIVGGEAPGSRSGSDLLMRVYDIEDPENPIRRFPSDFGLSYPDNSWHQGNMGWNAHGSAQYESLMLPSVTRVSEFGGIPELEGTNGIPTLSQLPIGYNRSSQAGPWDATLLWYNSPDQDIEIRRPYINEYGFTSFQTLGSFDLVGQYGGGDWHPMFFGDLLIYARSGSAARDGVVVYRLQYEHFDDADPENDSITPNYVGSLEGGFEGYWPNLFSDGSGLYVIGSATDILIGADITEAAEPDGDGSVTVAASMTVPEFTNASYPAYQDQFGFIHNRKVDMTRFLAGDANPIVLTLDEDAAGVDTSQMSLPLGNLWLTGGYPIPGTNQGMGVWVHQQAPDTTPPRVSYHIPQRNRVNYPRFAPLSFLVHEHSRSGGPRNGIDFTVRPVMPDESLGTFVSGFLIHDFSGNMTFTPDEGLTADTTYQVDFHADPESEIGFRDTAGNYIEPYSFRFSTSGGINASTPPSFTDVSADTFQPAPGEEVTISVSASGETDLEYRFNLDGAWSAWSSSSSTTHTYAEAGRPRVLVQARDTNGNLITETLRLLVIAPLESTNRPTQNSTMAIGDDSDVRQLWVANPDSNTVSVLNADTGAFVAEHTVGTTPRNIARDANGRYWVTCSGSDEIYILNHDGSLFQLLELDYGSVPFGIAPSPDGESLYVTLYNDANILRYSADAPTNAPLSVASFPTPRALAVSADGERLFVTRFITDELDAQIAEFDTSGSGLSFTRTIHLTSANTIDRGDRSAGAPNYLAGIAISPDGTRAAVVSKQDNIQRGTLYGVNDITHETTVRAVISFIDLETNQEIRHTRRDFDNSDSPSAVTYSPLGDTLFVTLQGNNRVVALDALNIDPVSTRQTTGSTETSPAVITADSASGLAPQGVLVDPVSQRLFAQNFMGRSVTVREATPFLDENLTSFPLIATTDTVTTELLAAEVLEGKQIFYNAADPRMSADSYISCASCHVDGGSDGRVWDFTGRGEGLRRTTDLRGRSGTGHGNVHWSGNFDEIQDFEHDIRTAFGGEGFLDLTAQEFETLHPSPATGKTGLSTDLDALAAYVTSLNYEQVPRSPHRNTDGTMSDAALRGRDLFTSQNCTACHSGDARTDSSNNPVASQPLVNIGSLSRLSGSRLGQTLTGIDTPTLHGLHATQSFLHHGQAETLQDIFAYAGGTTLTAEDAELISEIDPDAARIVVDDPSEGGGGWLRGVLTGQMITLVNDPGASTPPSVRFNNVDGGSSGGPASIAIHYARNYNNTTAELLVNGVSQTIDLLRQYPDNSWQTSGWRWIRVDTTLNAGPTNTIELLRSGNDFSVDTVIVSNADDLLLAQPHRLVTGLTQSEQDDLIQYLLELDGRSVAGAVLSAPAPQADSAPSFIFAPQPALLAEGNTLNLHVAVSGTGPFTFQWLQGSTPVGDDSPQLEILNIETSHAGAYSVRVSNTVGEVTSSPVQITVNPAISVSTSTLPMATEDVYYQEQLISTGGISTPTWRLIDGVMPPGLSLSEAGFIVGTPTLPARAELTLEVSDPSGSATQELSLDVQPLEGFSQDPDLILHYTFDERAGTQIWDISPEGNNHSTTVDNAHWIPNGRFGGGYGPSDSSQGLESFAPIQQTDLNFDPQNEAYTFSMWVRSTTTGGYRTILGKDRDGEPYDTQFRIWMTSDSGSIQAVNGNRYSSNMDISDSPLTDGEWHLVTLVNELESDTWMTRLYYDDGSQSLSYETGSGSPVPGLFTVGDTSRGGNTWNGQIDDLRIYKRALTQQEVAALYLPANANDYQSWMMHTGQLPALSDRDYTDDPDRDGSTNLEEYIFGGAPMDGSVNGSPQLIVSETQLRYQVSLNNATEGWRVIVETSENLEGWDPLATSEDGSSFAGAGTMEVLTVTPNTTTVIGPETLPDNANQRFYRTRIEAAQ